MDNSKPTVVIVILLVCCSASAFGCRCTEPTLADSYARADAVAKVRIQLVSQPSADGTVNAEGEVLDSWKVKLPAQIKIVTGEDCAYPLQSGETYILYLNKGDGTWGTYKCRGNRSAKQAGRTLHWLQLHGSSGH